MSNAETRKSHLALVFRQLLLLKYFWTLDHPLTNFSLAMFILRAVLSVNLLLLEFESTGKIRFANCQFLE